MAPDVQSIGVTAETRGIFVGPGNTATHLIGHDADVAVRGGNRNKIECNIVYTGIDEEFGRKAIVLCFANTPGASVYEHENRRVGLSGGIQIQRLNRRLPVRETFGCTEA